MAQKGLKICKEVALKIREAVASHLERQGRVPANIVEAMKRTAETDAYLHQSLDPEFQRGGGPAVERRK